MYFCGRTDNYPPHLDCFKQMILWNRNQLTNKIGMLHVTRNGNDTLSEKDNIWNQSGKLSANALHKCHGCIKGGELLPATTKSYFCSSRGTSPKDFFFFGFGVFTEVVWLFLFFNLCRTPLCFPTSYVLDILARMSLFFFFDDIFFCLQGKFVDRCIQIII